MGGLKEIRVTMTLEAMLTLLRRKRRKMRRLKALLTQRSADSSKATRNFLASDQETDSGKKVEAVKLGKVSVNPKTLIESESLLRPLGKIMPTKTEDRKSWRLDLHLKDAHFDVAWGKDEDSSLLVGIFLYGLGSWE